MARDELLPLVDQAGTRIGSALRSEVHGNPTLMHPVVHCLVVNRSGELLLQLRSASKDVQPGRWDTSVGGHVGMQESIEQAVVREIAEELGGAAQLAELEFLYRYVMRSVVETELVHTFLLRSEGPFRPEPGEIDELRFWSDREIRAQLGNGTFTPNFEDEYRRLQQWQLDRG